MTKPALMTEHAIAPRGLRREEAAAYIGLSARKFDELVTDGRMPQPKTIDGCRVWDRLRLDKAFDDLPSKDAENPWDRGKAA